MNEPLTPLQNRVYEAIRRRIDRGELGPSYRELCSEFGWTSTGTARDHLQALERKGYIELAGNRASRIRLREDVPAVRRIPVVGRVVAGLPSLAEEVAEGRMPVSEQWLGQGTYFALQVTGDSMRDAGILEGDYVVVCKQASAADGEIVVAV